MEFLIADTFTDSLARLTGDEQKAAKTTAFDLQMDPVNPGMALHRIDNAKDKNFWSARVGRDIRLIIHKTKDSFLLCYVDHHDAGYAWAERRRVETHPKTGAAQLVEIRERVQEIVIPSYVATPAHVAEKEKRLSSLRSCRFCFSGSIVTNLRVSPTEICSKLLTLNRRFPLSDRCNGQKKLVK